MKKQELQKIIREEVSKVLSEADFSIKQKINKFTKEVKALGVTDFYIKPVVPGSDKYLRKIWVNTDTDAKDLAAVRKWIMSHPEATKNVGIGAENYSYADKQNGLMYRCYAHNGYHYLSIEPVK